MGTQEVKEGQKSKWCSEALQAMATHLLLLQKGKRPTTCEALELACEDDVGPHLDLNSHRPLPFGWEQFLDLQSAQVYYIDWKNCRRSYVDPRTFPAERDAVDEFEECTSGADSGRVSPNKVFTAPMLQEDWDLMESRGWMALDCDDDRSEIVNVSSCSSSHV